MFVAAISRFVLTFSNQLLVDFYKLSNYRTNRTRHRDQFHEHRPKSHIPRHRDRTLSKKLIIAMSRVSKLSLKLRMKFLLRLNPNLTNQKRLSNQLRVLLPSSLSNQPKMQNRLLNRSKLSRNLTRVTRLMNLLTTRRTMNLNSQRYKAFWNPGVVFFSCKVLEAFYVHEATLNKAFYLSRVILCPRSSEKFHTSH